MSYHAAMRRPAFEPAELLRRRRAVGEAVDAVMGADSNMRGQIKTGLNREVIREIRLGGKIPREDQIRQFADGYGVDPEPLLRLAGYLSGEVNAGYPPPVISAPTNQEKIMAAWFVLEEEGLPVATRGAFSTLAAKLDFIRFIERRGRKLLPPDVTWFEEEKSS